MNRRIWNPSAQRTIVQINSTLTFLQDKALSVFYNEVPPLREVQHRCRITWQNHVPDRANGGRSFAKLNQYLHILNTNSYHCMLFDGSLIRVSFEFENDILLTQNLLWWPAPYDYSELLQAGFSPVEILEDLFGSYNWHETINMRTPFRIDFDSSNNTHIHPHSHLHIQNESTRLFTGQPICFNRFISFIFKNFYPAFELPFSASDYIQYKIPNLQDYEYPVSTVVI